MTSEQNQSHVSLPTAIVTFKSLKDAAIGLQTSWNNSPMTSYVTEAPAPSDIVWENIGLVKHYRYLIIICLTVKFSILLDPKHLNHNLLCKILKCNSHLNPISFTLYIH